jgi:hypothetical protein
MGAQHSFFRAGSRNERRDHKRCEQRANPRTKITGPAVRRNEMLGTAVGQEIYLYF